MNKPWGQLRYRPVDSNNAPRAVPDSLPSVKDAFEIHFAMPASAALTKQAHSQNADYCLAYHGGFHRL